MKIERVGFEEFLEMLGLDTDDLKDNEVDESEKEKEKEETTINETARSIANFIECNEAMKVSFKAAKTNYHQAISREIRRTLTAEETELVDIAFSYAFIDGWNSHKFNGGNNDK